MPTIRTSSRCLSPYFTKANFEIRRPDPNSNPPPTQNTPRNKPSGHSRILPNPTITRQYYLSQICNTVKKCISAVISPACKAITDQPKAKRRGGSRKATPWVGGAYSGIVGMARRPLKNVRYLVRRLEASATLRPNGPAIHPARVEGASP